MSKFHPFAAVKDQIREWTAIRRLKNKDPDTIKRMNIRTDSLSILSDIGNRKSIRRIVQALEDDMPAVRSAAASALAKLHVESAIDALITALQDQAPEVRLSVAEALGSLGHERGTGYLTELLKDKDGGTRLLAVRGLRRAGGAGAAECLMKQSLVDDEEVIRRAAAEALLSNGDEQAVTFFIVNLMKCADSSIRKRAAEALGILHDKRSADYLVAALEDEDEDVEIAAYEALSKIVGNAWRIFLPIIWARKDRQEKCAHRRRYVLSNGEYCITCGMCFRVS